MPNASPKIRAAVLAALPVVLAALSAPLSLPAHAQTTSPNYTLNFLPSSGGVFWHPTDINSHGQVVGTFGERHWPEAVLWNANQPAQPPTALPFYTPCCGYRNSGANAINDRGQVVGSDIDRAAFWNTPTSTPTLLSGEFRADTAANLNESGTVVGYSGMSDANGAGYRAAMWDASGMHNLGTLGGNESYAFDINESGTVAGSSLTGTPGGQAHATLWQGGSIVDLGAGRAVSLNDHDQVVGQRDDRAALWNGTQVSFLDAAGSWASDINNDGWVVGSVLVDAAAETTSARLWFGGQTVDLNSFLSQAARDAGWMLNSASAINEHGWIVGTAYNAALNSGRAYVLSIPAVPEPGSIALMLAGLGVIGAAARRTRRNRP